MDEKMLHLDLTVSLGPLGRNEADNWETRT